MEEDTKKIKNRLFGTKPTVRGIVLRFLFASTSSFAVLFGLLQISDWFGLPALKNAGGFGVVLLCIVSVFLAFIYLVAYLYVEFIDKESDLSHESVASTQIADLRAAYDAGRWNEVIKIGSVLSRPLWVTGKYKLRVEVGKMVEAASAYSGQIEQQASALIDDLGWTKFELGKFDSKEVFEAKANILHGIELAKKAGNYKLVYKGHRHLSGIALEKNDVKEAELQMQAAHHASDNIQGIDEKNKTEIVAGLRVNKALIEMKKRDWQNALNEINQAQDLYRQIGDKDREVKLYHFKGDILYEMDLLTDAKDIYREGLSAAKQESRRDGVLNNTIGIAKICLRQGENDQAKNFYLDASKVAREMGRDMQSDELFKIAQSIHK